MNRYSFQREDQTRINYQIRIPQVRVVDQHGEALGILPVSDAIARAEAAGLDLVEVAPSAAPPVCRIMDYGKFKYEKAKKQKEARKKQHIIHLKEIKLHPKIDDHDYNYKMQHARKFLLKGDRVKCTLVFRGREIAHIDFGKRVLDRFDVDLVDLAQVEQSCKREGRNMVSIYVPDKVKIKDYERKMEKEKKALIAEEVQEPYKEDVVEDPVDIVSIDE